ncbi:hypothetical protein FGE12_07965 [Aggregicoccus sp. 17bor-14]|nr:MULTISPECIES: alkaline phosphatase family protein [Myxococcaceae]MBF5042332.1 hypothetical protein [Simulacricoccus sp. 17bor-14]MRI88105.1 hypothetical protein [Aggregicoccus sp. 17bor-14]
MNSVPVEGDPSQNPVVHVYLGLDGLSHQEVEQARALGAFAGPGWSLARLIPMFPATSDASWTRMLHAPRFSGYEFGYYDPTKDKVYNKAVGGLLVHLVPPLEGLPFDLPGYVQAPAYYRAFDYHASAYLDALWSYDKPLMSYYNALDNLFAALAGHAETQSTFAGYVLEADVIGHLLSDREVAQSLLVLSDRIEDFKRRHPERTFVFTLYGDHGMDGVKKPPEAVVDLRDQLRAAGVATVGSLEEADKVGGPAAIAILHTRTTYVALHARPQWVEEVASRASTCPAADLVFARTQPHPAAPPGLVWTGAWREGRQVARYGYDAATDRYWLPADVDWAALDLPVAFAPGEDHASLTDEALFALAAERTYPDFFFRARTAFEPVSVKWPADVVVSFRHPYMSVGYRVPVGGGNDIGTEGSHGAMDRLGSTGAVLTEERTLPSTVRSDNLLELFPLLAEHAEANGVELQPGAVGAELDYAQLP